jgi:hypothetical protein
MVAGRNERASTTKAVILGLVPRIHAFEATELAVFSGSAWREEKDVDARDKPEHDGSGG